MVGRASKAMIGLNAVDFRSQHDLATPPACTVLTGEGAFA
jgi:hypothetical protein